MSTLADTYRTVESTVDYLRASTTAPRDDGWIACADVIDHPATLAELIRSTGPGRGSKDDQVAASLFVQGYAFRIPSVAIAAHALDRPRPSVRIETTAFRINRDRPAAVAHLDPEPSAADAADEVVGHLSLVIDAVRSEITVGERLLWGNVAASLAVIFRAVEGAVPDRLTRRAVRQRAADFFATAGARLDGFGSFETVAGANGSLDDGWFWARTNCCLWYRTTDGRMCDDCSLLDPTVRHDQWRAQLTGATS